MKHESSACRYGRSHQRHVIGLVAGLFLAIQMLAGDNDVSPQVIRRMKQSLAQVCVVFSVNGKETSEKMGSAFYLDRSGRFLTADHVIADTKNAVERALRKQTPAVAVIFAPVGSWDDPHQKHTWFRFDVDQCIRDERLDLATCHALANPFEDERVREYISPAPISHRAVVEGEAVAFSGFLLASDRPLTSKTFISFIKADQVPDKEPELVLDKTSWHGISGGPLYDAAGEVVGVMVKKGMGETATGGLSFARGLLAINQLRALSA